MYTWPAQYVPYAMGVIRHKDLVISSLLRISFDSTHRCIQHHHVEVDLGCHRGACGVLFILHRNILYVCMTWPFGHLAYIVRVGYTDRLLLIPHL